MKQFPRRTLIGMVLLALLASIGPDGILLLSEKLALQTVASLTSAGIHENAENVSPAEWALVPGTAVHGAKLRQRCQTAAALYHAGKVKKLLLSGDGRDSRYDEPSAMRRQLLALGIPNDAVMVDPEGLSTFDSNQKAAATARASRWLIVTQRAHAPRALFLASGADLTAEAVVANPGDTTEAPTRREAQATIRAILDLLGARSWTDKRERIGEIRVHGKRIVRL